MHSGQIEAIMGFLSIPPSIHWQPLSSCFAPHHTEISLLRIASYGSHTCGRCLDIIGLLADGASIYATGRSRKAWIAQAGAWVLATLVDLNELSKTGHRLYEADVRLRFSTFYVATGIPTSASHCSTAWLQGLMNLLASPSWTVVWRGSRAQGATGLLYQPSLATNTVPLHVTASGKAWLASLPRELAMQHVS
jgi:hypothetical protein